MTQAPTTPAKRGPKAKGGTNLPVRIPSDLRTAAERVAAATNRSVSNLCAYSLRRYIERNYPAALKPGAAALKHPYDDAPTK